MTSCPRVWVEMRTGPSASRRSHSFDSTALRPILVPNCSAECAQPWVPRPRAAAGETGKTGRQGNPRGARKTACFLANSPFVELCSSPCFLLDPWLVCPCCLSPMDVMTGPFVTPFGFMPGFGGHGSSGTLEVLASLSFVYLTFPGPRAHLFAL